MRPRLLLLVPIAAIAACAPPIAPLVEHHHAREALCALHTSTEADDRLIEDGLLRDLDPRVQVSYVDLPAGGDEPPLRGVRVRVATNAIPIDRLVVSATPIGDGVASGELHSLVRLTGETLPESRQVGGAGAIEEVSLAVLAIATLGILRIEPSKPHPEYPSEREYERAAPRAWAMSRILRSGCEQPATDGVAVRCTYAFAVRDPDSASVDVGLELQALPEHHESCKLTKRARLDLRPTADFRRLP